MLVFIATIYLRIYHIWPSCCNFWTPKPCWNQLRSYLLLVRLMNYIIGSVWCLINKLSMDADRSCKHLSTTFGEHKSKNSLDFQVFWNLPSISNPLPFGRRVVFNDSSWSCEWWCRLDFSSGGFFWVFSGHCTPIVLFFCIFRHAVLYIQLKKVAFFLICR